MIATKKILVIRFSSIGDIVLASPVLRCIKKQIENCELHFCTKFAFRTINAANPYIDKFFYYHNNMPELLAKLKAESYDHVVDLHHNFRSFAIKQYLKVDTATIAKLTFEKYLLTKLNIDIMPNRHITQRSLDTVSKLKVKDDGEGLDYFIPAKDEITPNDIPTGHLAGYIVIVIGASYATKKLPVNKLISLCENINHPIILVGGMEDAKNGAVIANTSAVKIYNACGKFTINESAAIIKNAKMVVSNDTGMLYIACAFKKPVVALWGSTTPDLDVEPYYGSKYTALQKKRLYENVVLKLSCQPCSKYGLHKCPKEHFNCMEKINVQKLADLVRTFL